MMRHIYSISTFSLVAALASCTSPPTPGMEWSCRNMNVEISCDEEGCDVATGDDFTPMDLTLDADGRISLCAYSGCWSGKAVKTSMAGNYFTFIGLELLWSGTQPDSADISATLNMKTMVATVLANDYAHPMTCNTSQ